MSDQEDIFHDDFHEFDDDEDLDVFQMASLGKRFVNYIIDLIVFFLFFLVLGFFSGLLSVFHGVLPDFTNSFGFGLANRILSLAAYVGYYTLCESVFSGKTLGKLITRTRAVTIDNQKMSLRTTFTRSLCRVVPFEQFSFLGSFPTGWHDSWSHTKVIVDDGWYEHELRF